MDCPAPRSAGPWWPSSPAGADRRSVTVARPSSGAGGAAPAAAGEVARQRTGAEVRQPLGFGPVVASSCSAIGVGVTGPPSLR
jgi:hypothetical protein